MVDPTPATAENERRIEHAERVSGARERYPAKGFPGWDCRGETLIRFGEPARISEVPAKLVQAETQRSRFDHKMPGEVWYYPRLGMVVPFEEVNLDGECTYYMAVKAIDRQTADEYRGTNVPSSEFFSDLIESYAYSSANIEELSFAGVEELLTFYSHLENGRYFHSAETEREPLRCYFDLTAFEGGGGKLRTEVNFEVPARELVFEKRGGVLSSRLEAVITAFDIEMTEVASSREVVDIELPEDAASSNRLIPAQFIMTLSPGYYRFGLEVRDLRSKKHGCYRMSRYLDPRDDGLCLSDIQFASSIGPVGEKKTFIKGPIRVVPHPLHSYRMPDPVKIYFEIYGLSTDEDDFAFYSVEYSIEPKEKRRWGPVLIDEGSVISSRFETSAYGSTQYERIEIDASELWEGAFRLRVTVMDRRTRTTAERETSFSILEAAD
jgi:GWxTD domain-containing protein